MALVGCVKHGQRLIAVAGRIQGDPQYIGKARSCRIKFLRFTQRSNRAVIFTLSNQGQTECVMQVGIAGYDRKPATQY